MKGKGREIRDKASLDSAMRRQGTFEQLVSAIRQVHEHCTAQAGKAVNIALTLRNWAIGFHIFEYEQHGRDRAAYGERLLDQLSMQLEISGMKRIAARELRRYRQFYAVYPHIRESLTPELVRLLPRSSEAMAIRGSSTPEFMVDAQTVLSHLSFTHISELIAIEDPIERTFYEVECIRGNWSVRELKRQMGSLYFHRSGLSRDKKRFAEMVRSKAEMTEPRLAIRDPYVFEFLGLRSKEVMGESDLEDALLDRLQDFLLELGNGFCFEARQKRVLIGDTHSVIDLVFYHRILKCHVLVELKLAGFNHEHMGQLNTYVSWYKRNMMSEGDSSPVGILLCTQKDQTMVEYALADLDNSLFVSRYQLELPDRKEIERFLTEQMALEDR